MRINAAINSLLGNATARSYSERVGHNTRPTHNNRFNYWQKKREEECRSLLKSAQVDANIRFGLYGVEVDSRLRLDDIDTFHAQFIPADMLKPWDLDNVGKQSGKMYPDRSLLSPNNTRGNRTLPSNDD